MRHRKCEAGIQKNQIMPKTANVDSDVYEFMICPLMHNYSFDCGILILAFFPSLFSRSRHDRIRINFHVDRKFRSARAK